MKQPDFIPPWAVAGMHILAIAANAEEEKQLAIQSAIDEDGKQRFLLLARNPLNDKLTVVAEVLEHGQRFHFGTDAAPDIDPENVLEPATVNVEVQPETALADIPMTDYRAAMIAEGVEEVSDEETYFAAWQHLEDTGLAYKLQGWFGRRLTDLIAEGKITPRQPQEG